MIARQAVDGDRSLEAWAEVRDLMHLLTDEGPEINCSLLGQATLQYDKIGARLPPGHNQNF
jgi:hypothetical protein